MVHWRTGRRRAADWRHTFQLFLKCQMHKLAASGKPEYMTKSLF